jgi:hypothetical protein
VSEASVRSRFGLRLRHDCRGSTAIEFAFILPAFLLFFIGSFEVAIVLFVGSSIESAVFEASRFGITGGVAPGVSREDRVRAILEDKTYGLLDMELVEIDTLIYDSFADIGQPEPFTDENANGARDGGEPFVDVNGNAVWDPDMGVAGLGGPDAVVVYRVAYPWGIITAFMRGVLGEEIRHVSSVAVRNEPF